MHRPIIVALSFCLVAMTACGSETVDSTSTSISEEFCARASAFEDADPTGAVFASDDPAVIEREWDAFDSLMAGLVETAPPEIAPDFETVAAAFGLLRSAYEQADWDLVAVFDVVETDPELKAAFEGSDPEVEAAGQRISAYLDEVCARSE